MYYRYDLVINQYEIFSGDECPVGNYCPEGSSSPTPCDPGFFNPATQQIDISDCQLCTAGYYCNQSGLFAVDGPCDPGNYYEKHNMQCLFFFFFFFCKNENFQLIKN